ncbi:hypothetical protein [Phenylobacterium sp.]|uniref:hypothetical protein n=1 Tax=Phenylobacterium sp. TaxID=1871053 RepID=UPI00391CAA96
MNALRFPLALAAVAAGLTLAGEASAGHRSGPRIADGPLGRPALAGRRIDRDPGHTYAERGVIGRGGHGYRASRDTTWGDGRVDKTTQRTWRNGAQATRTGSAVRNEDGSVSINRSRTGTQGATQTGWSTIYKTEDGYARDRGVSTSNGRSATTHGDIQVTDDTITVNRSATTGSGQTYSRTNTYTRRD